MLYLPSFQLTLRNVNLSSFSSLPSPHLVGSFMLVGGIFPNGFCLVINTQMTMKSHPGIELNGPST